MNAAEILNHLWQSTAFAGGAVLVVLALRNNAARVRFAVWLAASLKFLVPFSALAALGGLARSPQAQVAAAPALIAATEPFQHIVFTVPTYVAPASSRPLWPLIFLGVWLLGSAFFAVRWYLRWRRLSRIARAATLSRRLGAIPVLTTDAAIEPGIFGLFRPVLLLPAQLEDRLSPAQLEAVLAHEHCHARRRDNLWSALHMAVETLFWFHPLVWWIGGRLVTERELACDEAVLRQGGDPEAYASGILQVCRYYLESPLACAAGVSGGELKQRLAAILRGGWGRNLSRSRQLLLAGLAAVALLGPVAAGIVFGQSIATAPGAPIQAFDAASIKPSAPPSAVGGNMRIATSTRIDPGHIAIQNQTLKAMLQTAYNLQPYQIVGPDWISSERFDVSAETAAPVSRAQMTALLQPFLTRQFHLTLHHTTKVMPAYTLVVAKGGPKLKPASPAAAAAVQALGASPGRAMVSLSYNDQGLHLVFTGSMDNLVRVLGLQLDRPVVNTTGLTGVYDIDLAFARGPGFGSALPAPGGAPGPQPQSGSTPPTAGAAPSIFTALQQQLGLKLETRKAPVDLLVIDSGNKTPAGN